MNATRLRVLNGQGAAIHTTTAADKLVFGIFAALGEFERELIPISGGDLALGRVSKKAETRSAERRAETFRRSLQ